MVSLEGLDGVGKTALLAELADGLHAGGRTVTAVEEFPRSYLGAAIQTLRDREPYLRLHPSLETSVSQTLLLLSVHAFKFETEVRPALESGATVLVDRYVDSLFAYQIPALVRAGMSRESAWKWLDDCASVLPLPDIAVVIEADDERMRQRRADRGDPAHREDFAFLREVADAYEQRFQDSRRVALRCRNDEPLHESVRRLVAMVERALDEFDQAVAAHKPTSSGKSSATLPNR